MQGSSTPIPVVASHALALEAAAFRRFLGSVSVAQRRLQSPRALEAYWVAVEVVLAHQRGDPITQKHLTALSTGVWSPATVSRAVRDLLERKLLSVQANRKDRRSPLLVATSATLDLVGDRSLASAALLAAMLRTQVVRKDQGLRADPEASPAG